jgi:hypothetical protein
MILILPVKTIITINANWFFPGHFGWYLEVFADYDIDTKIVLHDRDNVPPGRKPEAFKEIDYGKHSVNDYLRLQTPGDQKTFLQDSSRYVKFKYEFHSMKA